MVYWLYWHAFSQQEIWLTYFQNEILEREAMLMFIYYLLLSLFMETESKTLRSYNRSTPDEKNCFNSFSIIKGKEKSIGFLMHLKFNKESLSINLDHRILFILSIPNLWTLFTLQIRRSMPTEAFFRYKWYFKP